MTTTRNVMYFVPWCLLIASFAGFGIQTQRLDGEMGRSARYKRERDVYLSQIERLDGARCVLDEHGIIREWNLGMEELLGFTADEVMGFGVAFLVPLEMRAMHREAFEARFQNPEYGKVQSIVCDAMHKSENPIQVEIRVRLEQGTNGRPVAIATFDLDESVNRIGDLSVAGK